MNSINNISRRPSVKNYCRNGEKHTVVISGDFSMPDKVEKSDFEFTPYIKCRGVSEMIQIDSGSYADECNALFGEEGFENRSLKELIADQLLDEAKTRLAEHIANKENYLDKAKWNWKATEKAQQEAAEIGGNPVAIQALYESQVAYAKQRSIEWYVTRLEELKEAVERAEDYQARLYDELDCELDVVAAEEEAVELPPMEQCAYEQLCNEMERMSLEQLVEQLDHLDTIPMKYHGRIEWLGNQLILEKMKASWRVVDFKVRCQEERVKRFCGQQDWKAAYRRATASLWNVDAAFSGETAHPMYKKLNELYQIRYGLSNKIRSEIDKLSDKKTSRIEKTKVIERSALELIPVKGIELCDSEGIEFTEVNWVPSDNRWELNDLGEWYYNTASVEV